MNDPGLPHGVIGRELVSDAPTTTTIRTGNENTPENLAAARLQFVEANAADFVSSGKRRWKDEGSGVEYREFAGACLLSIGEATRNVVCFFQGGDGRLHFLERTDTPQGITVGLTSPLRSGVVEPDGRIVWEGSEAAAMVGDASEEVLDARGLGSCAQGGRRTTAAPGHRGHG
jgi:hypothetical protein